MPFYRPSYYKSLGRLASDAQLSLCMSADQMLSAEPSNQKIADECRQPAEAYAGNKCQISATICFADIGRKGVPMGRFAPTSEQLLIID